MRITVLLIATLTWTMVQAGELTVDEYIEMYKDIAIEEMETTGIPASITLAQGILESRYGNSELSRASNNHFGIKCHTGWTGKRYYHDDDRKNECFRVYRDPHQSYRDHSEFLMTRSRYAFLFDYPSTDYENWAHGLKKAGYATNPKYGHLLIDLIERHELYKYDNPNYRQLALEENRRKNRAEAVDGHSEYKPSGGKVYTTTPEMPDVSARDEFSYNRIRTVMVKLGDSPVAIAQRHAVSLSRLMKYNDLEPGQVLIEGSFIYLQPKRRKARQRIHVAQSGETMWSISQLHGVRLSSLLMRNKMDRNDIPAPGAEVYLNTKSPNRPQLQLSTPQPPAKPAPLPKQKEEAKKEEVKPVVKEEKIIVKEVEHSGAKTDEAAKEVIEKNADEAVKRAEEALKKVEEEKFKKDAEAGNVNNPADGVPVKVTAGASEVTGASKEGMDGDGGKEGDVTRSGNVSHDGNVTHQSDDLEPVAVPRYKEEDSNDESIQKEKEALRRYHVVQKGDTLYGISKKYGISIADLKTWNKLESTLLSIDQKLIIRP